MTLVAPVRDVDLPALGQVVAAPLERAFAVAGGFGRLSPLARGSLPDSVTLLRVHARRGDRPVGVLQVSAPRRPGADDLVRREVERGRAVRAALGPRLGDVVLEPLAWFEDDERTYAAYPLCEPLPGGRWTWPMARARLRRPLLDWLREAARATRREPDGFELDEGFGRPLRALAEDPRLGAGVRDGAARALARLSAGVWRPVQVLAHTDLWAGNVLRWPARPWWRERAPAHPFVLIDWRGACVRGHGVRDLLSAARSLRLSPRALRAQLERHAWVLGCALQDTRGHALAGLGATGLELGCFEPRRWVQAVEAAWTTLLEALEA